MSTSAVLITASANAPGTIFEVEPGQVLAWLDANEIVLVDVRETIEYETDHIPGALLCPLSTFEADLFPRFPGKGVVLHCAVGKRSAAACKQLRQADYAGEVFNMAGGIDAWKAFGCPTEVQPEERKEIPFVEGSSPKHEPHALDAGAHPGLILQSEFMVPFGLTSKTLASEIGVPAGRISAVVRGNRRITPETALRLARHLCTTEEFWMRLQAAHDLENTRRKHGKRINTEVTPRRTGTVVRVAAAKGCD